MNRTIFTALAFLMILATIQGATAANITSCQQITTPGEYFFTQDVIQNTSHGATGDTCIYINGVDNITIDGQGYTLRMQDTSADTNGIFFDGTTGGAGVPTNTNITVKNLNIIIENTTDWYDAIDSYGYANSLFENINITFETQNDYGVIGMYHDSFVNMTLDNVNILGGEWTLLFSQGNSAIDSNSVIKNSHFESITAPGGGDNPVIYMEHTGGLTMYDNYFSDAEDDPMQGDSNADWNVYDNTFNFTTMPAGILGTNLNFNNTINGNTYINPSGTGFSETCTNDGTGICTADYTVSPNITDYRPVALSPAAINGTSIDYCGGTINSPGTYTVSQDLNNPSYANCINVTSGTSDVIIDCQGHTINGTGTSKGINFPSNNIRHVVKNCVFTNNGNAIDARSGGGPDYINNTFESTNTRALYIDAFLNAANDRHTFINNTFYSPIHFYRWPSAGTLDAFYNNIMNLTDPITSASSTFTAATWNTTKTSGTSILGGPYTGGNYWLNNTACNDADKDAICDSSYNFGEGTDYLPLTQPCIPVYECTSYDTCDVTDTLPCLNVTDTVCGTNFTGTISDYDTTCDYCTPNWTCNSYGECEVATQSQPCDGVADLNVCYGLTGLPSDDYTGNYSEFTPQACYAPGGFEGRDLPKIIIDFLGRLVVEGFMSFMSIIVLVSVFIVLAALFSLSSRKSKER